MGHILSACNLAYGQNGSACHLPFRDDTSSYTPSGDHPPDSYSAFGGSVGAIEAAKKKIGLNYRLI